MIVRAWHERDTWQICEIYNYYIENTVITFEKTPIDRDEMAKRIALCTEQYPWLVGELEGEIVGYAYATKWKERVAYKNTLEATIYLRHGYSGHGYGEALYFALLQQLKQRSCHVVLGCIALPNEASVRLHEKLGFSKAAHFNEVGCKFEQWLDVGYWQLILDA